MAKVIKAFTHAFTGLKDAFWKEQSFYLEVLVGISLAVIFSYTFWPLTETELLFVVLASALVFIVELLNTAIEKMWDFLEPKQRELVRMSKDTSAAAVLVSIFFAIAVALVIAARHLEILT